MKAIEKAAKVEKPKFGKRKPHIVVGTIGHIDHGKTTLAATLAKIVFEAIMREVDKCAGSYEGSTMENGELVPADKHCIEVSTLREILQRHLDSEELGEWIEWEGGECPVPDETLVELELRTGVHVLITAFMHYWEHSQFQSGMDIVRYRVRK